MVLGVVIGMNLSEVRQLGDLARNIVAWGAIHKGLIAIRAKSGGEAVSPRGA